MINAKKKIKLWMSAALESAGWQLLDLHALPPSYAKDAPVTPYFWCSGILTRPYGKYVAEGWIGVIHQEFEKTWLENPNREPQEQVHCMGLHLGNFKELVPKMFVPGDPNPNDVAEFCTAVTQGWLDRIPAPSATEAAMLEFVENIQSNSSLSCQIRMGTELDGLVLQLPESQR
jgi:hypothetical protein